MPPRVLVHGSGAIGTIYVYLLLQAGCEVTAVCRSNYSAAKAHGFTIDSEKFGQGIHIAPEIVRSPSEAASNNGPYDYVVISTKALPGSTPSTSEIIRPAVSGGTAIVLIQNGIGIEDEYAAAFPSNPIVSCVVYLPTTQTEPGKIQMGSVEVLQIGTHPASPSADTSSRKAAQRFHDLLKSAGSDSRIFDDIQEKRWDKLLINASWNPICALTLSRDVAYLASSDAAEALVIDVMMEVVAISQAQGYTNITSEVARAQLSRAYERIGSKGIEPSMLVDVLNGRKMEVEVILGNPIRIAKSLGVPVPRLETLYALNKALDEAMALRQPGRSLAGDETQAAKRVAEDEKAEIGSQ